MAKGKGELQTYWLDPRGGRTRTHSCYTGSSASNLRGAPGVDQEIENTDYPNLGSLDDKTARLIDWNVENLLRTLRQVVARRQALYFVDSSNGGAVGKASADTHSLSTTVN